MLTGARTAIAQDRLLLVEDLRLDKKIAESGMRSVGSSQCDNHFCITREVDCLACPERFVTPIRRTSMSSSGETAISVCASMPCS